MSCRIWLALVAMLAGGAIDAAAQPTLTMPEKARLAPDPLSTVSFYGNSAVATDGNTAVVGASEATVGSNGAQGVVYIYVRLGDAWTQQAVLTAHDGGNGDRFGIGVALAGNTVLVGALNATGHLPTTGAVYVFTRSDTTWTEQTKIAPDDGAAGDGFGVSIAIDGDTAIVGAVHHLAAGAAYILTRTGGQWTVGPSLLPGSSNGNDAFGISVALSGDTALVGALTGDGAVAGSGSAYVFTRSGSSWTQQARLFASDGVANNWFGRSVALQGDTALIGAPCAVTTCRGSGYLFTRGGTAWAFQAKLVAAESVPQDGLGSAVALSEPLAIVAARGGASHGAAYVFHGAGASWNEVKILTPSDSQAGDQFGSCMAMAAETVLVSAPENGKGTAYIFANTAPTLSLFGPLTTPEDTSLVLAFNVSDAELPPDSLVLEASSSSPLLVPSAGLVFGGSGSTRTLTITPAPNHSGLANIRLAVGDGFLQTNTFFDLTVTPVNDQPTLSPIADRTIAEGMTTDVIPITIGDVETPSAQLIVSANSSNPALVPNASLVLGGSGAARTLTVTPAPGAHGVATITVSVTDGAAAVTSQPFTLTVIDTPLLPPGPPTYYLAEGATGSFFDTDLLLANPNDTAASVTITFFTVDGTTIAQDRTLPPLSRTTIRVADIAGLQATSFSTSVTSTSGLPLVVERTMRWDATGYGAHGEKATEGLGTQWYFAEGSQGFFSTFFLLVNPGATPNNAHVTYFREGESELVRDYALLPKSRFTIDASSEPGLANRSFGALVVFDQPGAAERAMYFGRDPLWTGGHDSAGVTAPSPTWFLAEGATGSFFNTFVLIANPNATDATATLTYFPASGPPVTREHVIPGRQRVTINIADEDSSLMSAAVSTRVDGTQPLLVERSQYWPQPTWYEGHNSFGVTASGTHWGLAEGRVGGPAGYQTYILLANPGSAATEVTVRFLRTTGAPLVKAFSVPPASRFNIAVTGDPNGDAPELTNEAFGAAIESTQPIVVERAMYSNANGVIWAAGTGAAATRLP